ncbi:MAG TPA: NADH-quinone oxidoreductase subunit NuoN [Geminicoccaceae bacterium]|nr:NADH-quinone oxidoreductase subunit NuoN [Geminicoccaceae bacterium]
MYAAAFDFAQATPEIFLACAAMGILMVGVFRAGEADASHLVWPLAVMALVVSLFLLLVDDADTAVTFGGQFITDRFAVFLKVVILLGAGLCLMMSPSFMAREGIDRFEYPVLALFTTVGMMMMISANSLLALYIALELHSLPLYVMTAVHRDQTRSTEAGLKYFVLGALASGLLLYGCSLVYGFTGTLSFESLAQVFRASGEAGALGTGALIGIVFVAAGLAFKMAAVPFHMWTPDVYEGAPTPVTAFISGAPKVAAVGLALRVLYQPFGEWVPDWQQIVVFIAVASMLLGAFAAIGQSNIKRLLAYSSIGHIGFALVGFAAGTQDGVYSVLVYMTIYMIMVIGAFGCVLAMCRHGHPVEAIDDLAGLGRTQPLLAAAFAIFMFSMAGIPPLAGFFAKVYVFLAAIRADMVPLAVIGVLASVVGAYYYIRIVKVMYFDEPKEAFDQPLGRDVSIIVGITAAFNVVFCLLPSPLLHQAEAAAAALLP